MKTIKFNIPNMKSAHCQMTVRNVVESLNNVEIIKIEPTVAEFNIVEDEQALTIAEAISMAGYKVEKA